MLNNITMYRLVLYTLIAFIFYAAFLGSVGILPYRPLEIFASGMVLTLSCVGANLFFGRVFKAPINSESSYITGLILTLIILPVSAPRELGILAFLGFCAMASKFILAINKKHIFNPAALAAGLGYLIFGNGASWWIATPYMLVPILLGGLLIITKIQRWSLVLSFLITFFGLNFIGGVDIFLYSPLWFFSFVMLTEPQTSPTTKKLQILMGVIVGIFATPSLHIGPFFATPELALLAGNIFAYLIGSKKLRLTLKARHQLSPDTYQFDFNADQKLDFKPGQYLEWTIWQNRTDTRGNRRYFTIASSPTEDNLSIGVKIFSKSSSFKQALLDLPKEGKIVASQLAGEFTLPEDENKKLVFIAGGIGITPFRSMIKYLVDTGQKRDIVLLFSNTSEKEIIYKNIFDSAQKQIGLKVFYINTDTMGHIDEKLIRDQVTDFKDRLYYISGSHAMVEAIEKILRNMGVRGSSIKTDFFPGYA